MDCRIFVEKRAQFQTEANELRQELNENLGLNLKTLRHLCVYDLFGFSEDLLERSKDAVFGETVTDNVYTECNLTGKT